MLEYKCPCCGGSVQFEPSLQKLKCPYCDTEYETENILQLLDEPEQEKDSLEWQKAQGSQWQSGEAEDLVTYVCNSCGGSLITSVHTAAAKCPYCDSNVVMQGNLSGELRPDYVIPFEFDKAAAKDAFLKHLSDKKLLPKVFKDENHIEEIKGIYVPFWLYNAVADADMRYHATRIRRWSDSKYRYTATSHYSVRRSGNVAFERVPVDGSSKIPDDLMESVEPFDFSKAVDYTSAYLAGFMADKYDISSDACFDRANQRIRKSVEDEFYRSVVGYASVIQSSGSIRLNDNNIKYALYPVWLLTTNWNGNKYVFAMNGQTGKFVGNLPVDKSAYFKWLFGLTAVIGAVATALIMLFGNM